MERSTLNTSVAGVSGRLRAEGCKVSFLGDRPGTGEQMNTKSLAELHRSDGRGITS